VAEAHYKRHAQNVHARASTKERTPFQSRPRQYEICAGNGLPTHEGLASRKELFMGDWGQHVSVREIFQNISRTNAGSLCLYSV